MKNSFLILLILNGLARFSSPIFGQQPGEPVPGQLIVMLTPDARLADIEARWNAAFSDETRSTSRFVFQEISEPFHVWQIFFDDAFVKKENLLAEALRTPGVQAAQFNSAVDYRQTEPNDPQFFKQINLDLIRAADAWDASTGGVSPQGDTIVVAIMEKGLHRNHPDLRENMWQNRHEIPSNGFDDDDNGYIDDYRGWDVRNFTDGEGTVGFHGVGVSGIVGARADNKEGVSGVNWQVKLMTVVNCSFVSEIIAGYTYIMVQRRLYNQSGGQKGSFVVATNASFGIDNQTAEQQPIWCAMYDSLGKEGIVSVGATTNSNKNVDFTGDIPSLCPSEYLIVVTNVSNDDVKVTGAGFGPIHVDIGAPGDGVWTTDFRVGLTDTTFYGAFPGTSASTPHVSGAVAWAFSIPCSTLTSDALTDPSACAKRIRQLIFDGAEPNPSLKSITSTGGRLDLLNSLNLARNLCGGTIGNLQIEEIRTGQPGKITVIYQTPDYLNYTIRLVDMLGRVLETRAVQPDQFSEKKLTFDTLLLAAGVYTVVISNSRERAAKKFVKI